MSGPTRVSPLGRVKETLDWWRSSSLGLRRLRDDIRQGWNPIGELDELVGSTVEELEAWFREQLQETATHAQFTLLTIAEATLMTDFEQRCARRAKDPVSVAMRELKKRNAERRVPLDPDVLKVWANADSKYKTPVGQLRTCLKYRHWLAHGRYWEPKLGNSPLPPDDLAVLLADVMGKLGLEFS